jgi:hypothetical protein
LQRRADDQIYLRRKSWPSNAEVERSWREKKTVSSKVLELVTGEGGNRSNRIDVILPWTGLLLKRSRWPLGVETTLVRDRTTATIRYQTGPSPYAVLVYKSENQGEKILHVCDVRRERHRDSGLRVAFSIGIASQSNPAGKGENEPSRPQRKRMLLMGPRGGGFSLLHAPHPRARERAADAP